MRYGLYIVLVLLLSACKPKAEKAQLHTVDSLTVVESETSFVEPPLVGGSISLSLDDFGSLIELKGTQKLFDESGTAFSFKKYCSSLVVVAKSLIFAHSDAEAPP